MKLKKLLCLVLAILMMLSMVACGQDTGDGEKDGSSKKPSENPTVPSSTGEPTLEDIGPWVVTEEYDYRGDRFVYQYDEKRDERFVLSLRCNDLRNYYNTDHGCEQKSDVSQICLNRK